MKKNNKKIKITIDKKKCIGCGSCTILCPDVFELGKDGKSQVKNTDGNIEEIKSAAESCPVKAIKIEE
ncbi:MAG TPA: ferredoxin [Candidatus Pacearchaeota archaeon]|jgi:ferredoxin|nr:ferredoxin [Candidatus Paceibacterota bacterium]HOK00677.1 ferredoxin [Candidatus Pacearchaeota archaeon]HOL90451.1 ferredoxin [Candidatus Pacearchaeota archaeon]HOW13006.1 ferredoxin [Candidatus Pacearchaeota archaeon]HPO68424.1 ferredoxin [Candidatus Pacearchaeota archaeon]